MIRNSGIREVFPDMPRMKRVYRDKKASVHWSADRNKERISPHGFCSPIGLHIISIIRTSREAFMLLEKRSGDVSSMSWCRTVLSASPPCAPTRRARGMSGFWIRLVEYKTRTYNGRFGSECPAKRPGEVGQDWVPTKLFAQETKISP